MLNWAMLAGANFIGAWVRVVHELLRLFLMKALCVSCREPDLDPYPERCAYHFNPAMALTTPPPLVKEQGERGRMTSQPTQSLH